MQIEKAKTEYSQYRIPGLVITEKGTLLGYYECRRTDSDWADIDLKIIRSTDRGESWTAVKLFESGGDTLNNPVMIVHGEKIHLLFFRNYRLLYHCVSVDDGLSFSEPREITASLEAGGFFFNAAAIGPGHGIVHGGRLLVPVWFAQNREEKRAHHPSIIGTLYSEDDGETWRLGEILGIGMLNDPSECALAVTAENRVLISIRNENECRQRAFAVSNDGCGGWENLHFSEAMPDPICQGSMCAADGKVFHINCASTDKREKLTVKISTDGFETYQSIPVDDPGGYADIAVHDGVIYAFYEKGTRFGGLYFKAIPVDTAAQPFYN